MVHFKSVKCPECGAQLNIEDNRKEAFCTYCGTKIMISNDNEYEYHYYDEADIKRSEVNYAVRMRELQLEEKGQKTHKGLIVIWVIALVILTTLGVIGISIQADGLIACGCIALLIGLWGGMELFGKKK